LSRSRWLLVKPVAIDLGINSHAGASRSLPRRLELPSPGGTYFGGVAAASKAHLGGQESPAARHQPKAAPRKSQKPEKPRTAKTRRQPAYATLFEKRVNRLYGFTLALRV